MLSSRSPRSSRAKSRSGCLRLVKCHRAGKGNSQCARPVRRGRRERSSQTEQRSQRGTNGEEDVVRPAGWGVTPAAAGVRVARGRDGRKWPTPPPTCAARARYGGDGESGVYKRSNGANGGRTEKGMSFDSAWWGVTPAAGRRPSDEGSRRAQVAHAPTHLRSARPLVTRPRSARSRPRRAASSPFRLRSLRCSVVNSVTFATSCSRPPQLLGPSK